MLEHKQDARASRGCNLIKGLTMRKNKVLLVYNDNEEYKVESVWTKKVGENYQIENIPFFANNIALGDIVSVEDDEGELYFEELIEASENSTIRIVFFEVEHKIGVCNMIEKFECDWEGSHLPKLVSINVPSDVNYKEVKSYLDSLNIIDYQEGCLSSIHQFQVD